MGTASNNGTNMTSTSGSVSSQGTACPGGVFIDKGGKDLTGDTKQTNRQRSSLNFRCVGRIASNKRFSRGSGVVAKVTKN